MKVCSGSTGRMIVNALKVPIDLIVEKIQTCMSVSILGDTYRGIENTHSCMLKVQIAQERVTREWLGSQRRSMRKTGLHLDPVKPYLQDESERRSLKLGKFKEVSTSSDETTQAREWAFHYCHPLKRAFHALPKPSDEPTCCSLASLVKAEKFCEPQA